ncbi:hypothetical protein VII00023_16691, partial [Vibrio ichthyoenteri ATCC 700023]
MDELQINGTTLRYKKDEYPLAKIKDARVKINTLKDHALRVIIIGLVVSSLVWIICPESFAVFTAPIALSLGMLSA